MDIWILEDDYIFQNKLFSMLDTYKDALEDTSVLVGYRSLNRSI